MSNEKKGGNLKIAIEYISDDDSLGENDFKTTAKLISLMPNGIEVGKVNKNNKNSKNILHKKNTRMSSNNDDIDSENNNENKSVNNNLLTENDNNDNLKSPISDNVNNNSYNNLIFAINKKKYLFEINNNHESNTSLNKFDKLNNSENNHINYLNDDNEKLSLNKKSSFSPIKKRKKIILEEKKKNRGLKRSIYAIEPKEEKKEEEEKKYRKDKNGTVICKKNKKKVKIEFLEPLAKIIPIESYKKYNIIANMPKGERFDSKEKCQCCFIF